jgi:predicted aspartyl protease
LKTEPSLRGFVRAAVYGIALLAAAAGAQELPEAAHDRIEGFSAANRAVTVPFTDCAGHICVDVSLDGAGPFHFLLDTGSRNVLTRKVFDQLHLTEQGNVTIKGTGYRSEQGAITKIGETRLAGLSLRDQPFIVIPAVGNSGLDGTIGYEWFRRAPILLDYPAHRITLYDPAHFSYEGRARATPLAFSGLTPQIAGALDGVPGTFSIDTGSDLFLTLSLSFIAAHDLLDKYRPAGTVKSLGMGGASTLLSGQGKLLHLGGLDIAAPVLEFPTLGKGVFAETEVAGNIGNGILKNLTLLFNYAGGKVYLDQGLR